MVGFDGRKTLGGDLLYYYSGPIHAAMMLTLSPFMIAPIVFDQHSALSETC